LYSIHITEAVGRSVRAGYGSAPEDTIEMRQPVRQSTTEETLINDAILHESRSIIFDTYESHLRHNMSLEGPLAKPLAAIRLAASSVIGDIGIMNQNPL
jgi:hypothetical protein